MITVNNFAKLCTIQNNATTNIAMFFDSDLAQKDSTAEPATIENTYSKEEEQRRVNLCERES
jgi:hypothetical protein